MAGFGSFMEGMQSGMKSGTDLQAAWDKRDLTSATLDYIDNENAGQDFVRANNKLPPLTKRKRTESIGERFANWLSTHLGGGDEALTTSTYVPPPMEEAIPTTPSPTAAPAVEGLSAAYGPEYADGGRVRRYADGGAFDLWDDEKANGPKKGDPDAKGKWDDPAKRAAQRREARPAEVASRTEKAGPSSGAPTAKPESAAKPEPAARPGAYPKGEAPPKKTSGFEHRGNAAPRPAPAPEAPAPAGAAPKTAIPEAPTAKGRLTLGKGVSAGVGGALAAIAGMGAGAGYNRGYYGESEEQWAAEDARLRELARKAPDLTPEEQQEVTALRTKFEMRQRMGSMEDPNGVGLRSADWSRVPGALVEAGKGAVGALIPDNMPGRTGPAPAPAPTPAPAQAIPTAPTAPSTGPSTRRPPADPKFEVPDPAAIDWSKLKGVDIPQYDTKDWIAFRKQAKEEYIMTHRGITSADAEMYADQQVTQMQQSGFLQYLKQTAVLLKANDPESAAKAAAMAFHFMPVGTSVKPGVYNGHAVLFPYDEETGKPEGNPVVLNEQLLSDIATQFSNPANWEKVVQDRAGVGQKDRQLDQMDTQLGIMQQNADTNEAYYGAKAEGTGGLKPVDIDRIRDPARGLAAELLQNVGLGMDPAAERDIADAIIMMYVESGGRASPESTARKIENLLRQDPDGLNKLRAELSKSR